MTDEQIEKGLECLASEKDVLCAGCEYRHFDGNTCHKANAKDAIALIQRHRAEIDRLTTELEAMRMECNSLKMRLACSRAGAVGEFMLRVLDLFPSDKKFTTISRATIWQIAQEMKEGEQ